MADGAQLLRMLEPAVRPGNLPGPVRRGDVAVPIEQQSFESLLAQVSQRQPDVAVTGDDGQMSAPSAASGANDVMRLLGQLNQVENAKVLEIQCGREARG